MQLYSDVDVELLEIRVELRRLGGRYALSVTDWMGATVTDDVGLSVEPDEVQSLRETAGVKRVGRTDSLDPAQLLGRRLFDVIFGRRGGLVYKQALSIISERGRALRLRLVLDDDLLHLPWELLYDREFRNDFLALGQGMTLVRQRAEPGMVASVAPVRGLLRVLVVAWDRFPTYTPDIHGEIDAITAAMGARAQIEVLDHPSPAQLAEALAAPHHVLHYIGTGVDQDGGAQAIMIGAPGLRDEQFVGAELVEAVRAAPDLCLVVLNGCRTDRVAAGLSAVVPTVIGMQGDVTDQGAIVLARTLYEQFAAGAPVEMALASARRMVDYETPGRLDWSAPVMYLRSGGMPLVARSDGGDPPIPTPTPPPPPSTDVDAARQRAERRLNIDERNLEALRVNARQFGEVVPAAITSQLQELEARLHRARLELGIVESA